MNNPELQYQCYNEESGILGEIFAGFFKKGEQKSQQQLESTKSVVSLIEAKQRAAAEKFALQEANRLKMIKIVAIVLGVLIVSIAVIVAIIQIKKNQAKKI